MCSTQKRADYEDFSKGSSETSDTKPFAASKDGYTDSETGWD